MAVSAKDVQELRARTNVGMMDCKRALQEADGDMEKAIEILRTRGIAKAESRSGRSAKEGLILAHVDAVKGVGALIEVNSETDFVARTREFQDFVESLASHLAGSSAKDVEDLLSQTLAGEGKAGQDLLTELVAKCGENVTVRRFERFQQDGSGLINAYIHTGSKLGVMVELGVDSPTPAVEAFAKDVSMHIAASAPLAISRDALDTAAIERERKIFREQAVEEGRPEKVLDRIVDGRIEKYYQDVCLLEQPFVKDPDHTVRDMVNRLAESESGAVVVKRFVRFVLGEES